MYKILLRLIFTLIPFIGTFMGVFVVMVSALLNLNEVEPINPAGNAILLICAVIASFFIAISIISNINNFISET